MNVILSCSVPANLLLIGEYAVTEEDGLGISVAIDRRVMVTAEEAQSLICVGRMRTGEKSVIDLEDQDNLVSFIICELLRRKLVDPNKAKARLTIDSTAFFSADGQKLGYGSSAAVTVALCSMAIRLWAAGNPPNSNDIPQIANDIHWRFQGGKGSGYDIYSSFYGGTGLFSGGLNPTYTPIAVPWFPEIFVRSLGKPVRSGSSIDAYHEWRLTHPGNHRQFISESNRNTRHFAKAHSWREAAKHLIAARGTGLELGRSIGVPADIPADLSKEANRFGVEAFIKALGAGNELAGLFIGRSAEAVGKWSKAPVSEKGLIWL